MDIVICDDNKIELEITTMLLKKLLGSYQVDYTLQAFTRSSDCFAYLAANSCHLLIMDIYLDQGLGTELCLKLRQQNRNFKLVFLSSSNEFATESFQARASYYLLKPTTEDKLAEALEACHLLPQAKNMLQLSSCQLNPMDIVAIEVQNKYCFIHTQDQVYQEYSSLNRIMEQLQADYFLSPHRSFVLNMHHIKTLQGDVFVMNNGFMVPIKSRGSKAIKDAYMDWLFENM